MKVAMFLTAADRRRLTEKRQHLKVIRLDRAVDGVLNLVHLKSDLNNERPLYGGRVRRLLTFAGPTVADPEVPELSIDDAVAPPSIEDAWQVCLRYAMDLQGVSLWNGGRPLVRAYAHDRGSETMILEPLVPGLRFRAQPFPSFAALKEFFIRERIDPYHGWSVNDIWRAHDLQAQVFDMPEWMLRERMARRQAASEKARSA